MQHREKESRHRASQRLQNLSESALARRLGELIASMGEGPQADEQRSLLLDLQVHQIEVEMQVRELREAQQALELSRNRYARLFDLAPVGYAVFDHRGRILEINLTAARMLHRPRSQVCGLPFASFLEKGEARAFLTHVQHVLDTTSTPEQAATVELYLCADMGARLLRLHSLPRDGNSGPVCFSVILDITAQGQAERPQLTLSTMYQT